ncbi:homogentisate 1,2-dioxygenase, partial [Cladophialophora psammophila CBS 110553]
ILTATSNTHPGTTVADFLIFPTRWLVAEDACHPPFYHRNCMSEFKGLIQSSYIASLNNCLSSHGPEPAAFDTASREEL